jgi:hypothetical protein
VPALVFATTNLTHTCYCSQLENDLQFVRGQMETEQRSREIWQRQAEHLVQKHQAVDKSVYEALQVRAVY